MSEGKAARGNSKITAFCLKNKMDHISLESFSGNIAMWYIILKESGNRGSFLLHIIA